MCLRAREGMHYNSGPQPLWHHGLVLWKTIFPRTRSKGGDRRQSSGGNVSEGSLTRPPPTSCCAAWFLVVPGHQPGGWGPLHYKTKYEKVKHHISHIYKVTIYSNT